MQLLHLPCYALGSIIFTSLAAAQSASSTSGLIAPAPTPSIFPNSSQEFYIRADLQDPSDASKAHLNGLYLYSYHTGAGLSDVTFAAKASNTPRAWINYTSGNDYGQLTFNLDGPYPWTMSADFSNYREWSPMYINAGQGGNEGYRINESGLVWDDPVIGESFFGGWLVCDWWHGVPQLFWHNSAYNLTIPCNCAQVWLCPEYI